LTKLEAIRREQALYIKRNITLGACATAAAIWLIVYLYYPTSVRIPVLIWAGLFSFAIIHWMRDARAWARRLPQEADQWLRYTPFACSVGGCVLGAGAFIILPAQQPGYELFFFSFVCIVSVMSIFSYAAHYPTFVGMVMPLMLITLIAFAGGDTPLAWATAAAQFLVIIVVLYFARTFNRVFVRSVELRFENQELVEQLRVQIYAAESANMAKSRFLAAASHDLRQPMHALNLYLGAMGNMHIPAEAKPLLDNASECAQAMDDMFRALLDVSSLDAGAVGPELSVFPIASVLERVRIAFTPAARDKGLRLDVVRSCAFVRSDPALVERILGNLVSNAIRYTQEGRVLVGCRRRGDELLLQVFDTGVGISADKQALIFEEFYQVANSERDRSQGLGLGLAIVERLARLLDATIFLNSQVGKGSIFSFSLPRAEVRDEPAADRVATAVAGLRNAFIVVVDDEKLILDATRVALEQQGSLVLTAGSGVEALRQLAHSRRVPDALVCDYRLRAGENGLEVIEAIREEFNEDIPAMLMTGDTAPDRLRELQASGFTVLHKPIREGELLNTLAVLMPSNEAGDEAQRSAA
jgi:two-component system, sensor histidine kinase